MYCYCEVCNGQSYMYEVELEKKDGSTVTVLECEDCESTFNMNNIIDMVVYFKIKYPKKNIIFFIDSKIKTLTLTSE